MNRNNFYMRHIGPRPQEVELMLKKIGVGSLDELIDATIPGKIRMESGLDLPEAISEHEYLEHIREIGSKNKIFRTYIGLGYYNTITPSVITRNILENPGWYTSYTPYQAEISQGRLEALLNFQTMVSDLTGLPIANASLLDEGTAAAESMTMFFNSRSRDAVKAGANKFFVARGVFPQTLDILKTRSKPLGIELVVDRCDKVQLNDNFFGALLQYPDERGMVRNYASFIQHAHDHGVSVAVAADLLSLAILTPPGEWGADVALGSTQRFGVPMGYGGPHAAYFATTDHYKRNIPGRIIGVSVDARGNRALRMALQTREQHIKRERATSNICTAQALLATMAGMYAVYHGPEGIYNIAMDIHQLTITLANELGKLGVKIRNDYFFDTLEVLLPENSRAAAIEKTALSAKMNFRYIDSQTIGISLDETTSLDDVYDIVGVFSEGLGREAGEVFTSGVEADKPLRIPDDLRRKSKYLQHEVFNSFHSETEMMRYLKKLENKDLALNRTMIPLGSCTMKLNAASEMFSITWPEFANIHPFVPVDQALGYQILIENLEKDLCEITGFAAVSLQPNSGASGEYTGLMVIRAYHESNGQGNRNVCLIPSSAHGTNPASSVMAGMNVVIVRCDEKGNIDINDLRQKAEEHRDNLAALMVTYPSTHGVFEEDILEITEIIHKNGGQVYMDGANMNAQVGYTNPAIIGADVCHLNLHKTFAIPHGGGGPGVGPIGVAAHLAGFLPGHVYSNSKDESNITAVAAAPYGSALILPISYGYIKMLGAEGLKESTRFAILNANYLKSCLEHDYKILYSGKKGRVAHEFILDCNAYLKTADITVVHIAKRLMDYGFHAPTVAFPVHGTLMVEPTESEPLAELDRFVEAMLAIRKEIAEVEQGKAEKGNNLVCNAPHTMEMIILDDWSRQYDRKRAAFPVSGLSEYKYWPPVTRIDDAYGDRNLVCTCQPAEDYMEPQGRSL